MAYASPATSLTIAPSPFGLGAFAPAAGIPAGSLLCSISSSLCMTVGRSARTPLGRLALAAFPPGRGPPAEFLLLLDMALGRADPAHRDHAFLASLPAKPADAPSWPACDRRLLAGTNLAAGCAASSAALEADIARFLPALLALGSGKFGALRGGKGIRWARACYRSRRFPASLIQGEAGDGPGAAGGDGGDEKDVGILLPFMDLLNHRRGAKIEWEKADSDDGRISFRASEDVRGGEEVFNNYGSKSNEELLMCYGFALRDNPDDAYRLKLGVGGGEERVELGVFSIRRGGVEGVEQFPKALWRALASLYEEEEEEEGGEGGAGGGGEEGGVEGGEGDVAVGIEEVELLLATLSRRLEPFDETRAADEICERGERGETQREAAVAMYRCGQGEVLRQAVQTLKAML
ncbi:hypothetical protein TeGR_g2186 [Tetraparma gracilis]|uniref:SET domain-containing protein n=1 Tax=Tetraparma gracilis TaxID=2962635 RepID=A0ABQ6N5Y5_9STRA|nr:hypothetical protein TeGR_g2186 [Tetraparma gracilis]